MFRASINSSVERLPNALFWRGETPHSAMLSRAHMCRVYAGSKRNGNGGRWSTMYPTTHVLLAGLAFVLTCADQSIFEQQQVVPDVLDESPSSTVRVTYEGGEKVQLGNVLTPTKVQRMPTITWDYEDGGFYTLILTDPDAPSRTKPTNREFLHFLVGNIPGNKIESGETLAEYIGSGPPKGTGLHRYVFIVYKQPGKINFNRTKITNRSAEGRPKFSARQFAKDYNLGKPIAANFYQAEWDEYVPILQAQLG